MHAEPFARSARADLDHPFERAVDLDKRHESDLRAALTKRCGQVQLASGKRNDATRTWDSFRASQRDRFDKSHKPHKLVERHPRGVLDAREVSGLRINVEEHANGRPLVRGEELVAGIEVVPLPSAHVRVHTDAKSRRKKPAGLGLAAATGVRLRKFNDPGTTRMSSSVSSAES
jgi:hypothetical protein